MLIKFKEVSIKNFLAIGQATVELSNRGFTLISGRNNNITDNAQSNGAGKSSIICAIVWAITGETIRGTKDIVNRYGDDGASVDISFEIDNIPYRIIRYKDTKQFGTNLKLYVNGEDKSGKGIRDTEKILSEYLPDITAELLGSVVVLGQGLPQRFTNNTPSGRKEILEKLSKSDFMIVDIKERLATRKNELLQNIRQLDDNILSTTSMKTLIENQLIKLKNNKALLVDKNAFDADINKTEQQLATLNTLKYDLEHQHSTYQSELEIKFKTYQDWISKVERNFNSEESHILDELIPYKDKINSLNFQIETKLKEIRQLEAIKDVCPTCGQHLPDVHKVDTSSLHTEVEELQRQLDTCSDSYKTAKADADIKIKNLRIALDTDSAEFKAEYDQAKLKIDSISTTLQKYDSEINNLTSTLDKLNLNKQNNLNLLNTIDSDIAECECQLKQFEDILLYNNIEKTNKNNHLDIINKMITVATRDFRGYLLSGIIDFINSKAREYSQAIFNTDKIDFCLDNNNIFIGYCGKAYENLSGGEKQRVDIIVQFALRDMLSQFLNFSCNILVLDELFDAVDQVGCESILNLITTKLKDIESIFIITHHADIAIPCDNEITIVKNNKGISEIL